jgi:hypothetical protein
LISTHSFYVCLQKKKRIQPPPGPTENAESPLSFFLLTAKSFSESVRVSDSIPIVFLILINLRNIFICHGFGPGNGSRLDLPGQATVCQPLGGQLPWQANGPERRKAHRGRRLWPFKFVPSSLYAAFLARIRSRNKLLCPIAHESCTIGACESFATAASLSQDQSRCPPNPHAGAHWRAFPVAPGKPAPPTSPPSPGMPPSTDGERSSAGGTTARASPSSAAYSIP